MHVKDADRPARGIDDKQRGNRSFMGIHRMQALHRQHIGTDGPGGGKFADAAALARACALFS